MTSAARSDLQEPVDPAHLAGPAIRAALFFGVCLAIYSPVFLQEYAITDDWALLEHTHAGFVERGPYVGGRPIYGLLSYLGFRAAGSVTGLAWLRLVAVLGLSTFALVLHRHLERNGWSFIQAACISFACVALPGPMLYASWATCFPQTWALTIAGVAFLVSERAASGSLRSRALSLTAATLLLTSSFLTYQPTAPAFWAFFAISFFARERVGRAGLAFRSTLVFGLSASLGLVAVTAGKALNPSVAADRTAMLRTPIDKLRWFIEAPLVEAWSFVLVPPSVWTAAICVVLAAFGIALGCRRVGVSPVTGLAGAGALLLASYAPNLAVAENFPSYRSEASLAIMAAVLAAIALRGWASVFPRPDRVLTPVLATAAAAFLLTASFTLQNYLVRPHSVELSWLRAALSAPATRVLVIPRPNATVAPETIHDELGFPSITTGWVAAMQVPVIMRERGFPPPRVVFPDGTNADEFRVTPGTNVVDTGWLERMRGDFRP